MGLFNKLFGKDKDSDMGQYPNFGSSMGSNYNMANGTGMGVNTGSMSDLTTVDYNSGIVELDSMKDTDAVISLRKSVISLDKTVINLSKEKGIDLTKHQAKVAVVMDYSGSMSDRYENGEVQRVLNRLIPLSLRFDDNGELEVWIFSNKCHRLEPMTLHNFEGYVNKEIMRKYFDMGSTEYAPVLNDVMFKYFVEDKATSNIPTFVMFITDGDNDYSDKKPTDSIIKESSDKNIYLQFVGMGKNSDFDYLQKLDNLPGRRVDNTGFIKVRDFSKLTDEELYAELLSGYTDWTKNKRG